MCLLAFVFSTNEIPCGKLIRFYPSNAPEYLVDQGQAQGRIVILFLCREHFGQIDNAVLQIFYSVAHQRVKSEEYLFAKNIKTAEMATAFLR